MNDVSCLRAPAPVEYSVALRWQRATAEALRAHAGAEALAILEHEAVYTMGARGGRATVLTPLEALPAPLVDVERGGDITWHGPGQLVAYPILDLRARGLRAADYVRRLEATLLAALDAFGIAATTTPGRPGVWVGPAKVAAIGVSIRGGVSSHGIALNVDPALAWFDAIVPCGIPGAGVTSMARLLGVAPSMDGVAEALRAAFEGEFGIVLVDADPAALFEAIPA